VVGAYLGHAPVDTLGKRSHLLPPRHQHLTFEQTALELEGFGANLQHYNPVIDAAAAAEWDLPKSWSLKAQLCFGGRAGDPGEKTFEPVEGKRLRVFGK
jgi:uncharacterized protein